MNKGLFEFANRTYMLYEMYELANKFKKSRKKKEYIRKAFKLWYKCPNWEGKYNNDFWKFITKFNSNETFNKWFFDNSKLLTINQYEILFKHLINNSN